VNVYEPVTIGWDHENNRAAKVPVPGHKGAHWLIGGASGGGKSQAIHAALAQLAERDPLALVVNDAALMDYIDWTPRVSCMALGRQGGAWMLEQAQKEMIRRLRLGREMGVQSIEPSAELPHIVYVFDELAMVMMSREIKGAAERLIECAQVFRKTAQGLMLCTQHPKATIVPTILRGQCAVRLCLRTKEREATDAILDTQRIPAHEIPFNLPGVGFVELPTGEIVKIRVPFVTPDEVKEVAGRTANLAPYLPPKHGWMPLYDPYEQGDEDGE
jgi:DNA segregation ATPase FtsK/SpoIIIE-like protein